MFKGESSCPIWQVMQLGVFSILPEFLLYIFQSMPARKYSERRQQCFWVWKYKLHFRDPQELGYWMWFFFCYSCETWIHLAVMQERSRAEGHLVGVNCSREGGVRMQLYWQVLIPKSAPSPRQKEEQTRF